jgi:hypothetical protein
VGHERHWIARASTHRVMQEVFPLDGGTAEESFSKVGAGTFTFPIGRTAMDFTYEQGRDLTTPNSRFVTQGTESRIEYTGLIKKRRWSEDLEAWVVQCKEVRSLFSQRFPHYVGEYGTPMSTVTITNKSLRHAVSQLIDLGANRGRERWDLRLTPGINQAGSFSDVLERAKMTKLEHALTRYERMPDGPNWHLKPTWEEPGLIRFDRRIGAPRLDRGTFDFDLDAPDCPVIVGDYEEDGEEQSTGLMVQADGIGEGKIIAQVVEGDLADDGGGYDGFFLDDALRDDALTDELAFERGLAYLTAHQRPAASLPIRVRLRRDGTDPVLDPGARLTLRTATSRGLPPTSTWYVTGVKYRVGSDFVDVDSIPLPA